MVLYLIHGIYLLNLGKLDPNLLNRDGYTASTLMHLNPYFATKKVLLELKRPSTHSIVLVLRYLEQFGETGSNLVLLLKPNGSVYS